MLDDEIKFSIEEDAVHVVMNTAENFNVAMEM